MTVKLMNYTTHLLSISIWTAGALASGTAGASEDLATAHENVRASDVESTAPATQELSRPKLVLRRGEVVTRPNDEQIDSPQKAMELYNSVKAADTVLSIDQEPSEDRFD